LTSSSSSRSVLRILVVVLLVAVAALAAYLRMAQNMADPDQFWHIATGRWIVQNGAIPTHDVFSWWAMANGREWAAHEWLFGVLIYSVWSLGGFVAVYWFAALLEAAAVGVVYALTRARGVSPLWSLLVTITAAFGTMFWLAPRPQMVTFVLIPLTALLLQKNKWPLALAVVALGVNLHGGVWPLYVLVFALYEFPKRWWLVLAAIAATLINPNPLGTLAFAFGAFTNPRASNIIEFTPTVLWEYKGDLAVILAMVMLTRLKRIPWKDGLFGLAFVILALSAIRHLQWIYVIVLPILAPYMTIVGDGVMPTWLSDRLPGKLKALFALPAEQPEAHTDDADTAVTVEAPQDEAAPEGEAPTPARLRVRGGGMLLELVLAGALVVALVLLSSGVSRQKLDVDRWYPADIISYMKLYKVKRLFNIWHEGGYLILKGIEPMIDGRGDPYVAQEPGQMSMMDEYLSATRLEKDPITFVMKVRPDYLLTNFTGLYLVIRNDPRFVPVKQDEFHILYRVILPPESGTATPTPSTATTPTADGADDAPAGQWLRNAVNAGANASD
jgi:hypothetical protein